MDKQITDQIIAEAEHWFNMLGTEQGSYTQRRTFTDWYEQSLAHQKAYAQVAFVHEQGFDFSGIATETSSPPLALSTTPARPQNLSTGFWGKYSLRILSGGQYAAMGAAMFLIAILTTPYLTTDTLTEYATATGEIEQILLSDGSKIMLGAQSRVETVEFTDSERRVYMREGEAFFSIAHDKDRPFIVISDNTRIQVLGTQFNVNKSDGNLQVSLLEGSVEIIQAVEHRILPFVTTDQTVQLMPTQTIAIKDNKMQMSEPKTIEGMATWRIGQLTYNNMPFIDVVADMRRYTDKKISLADSSIGALPITATFASSRVESVIEELGHILPVFVKKTASGDYIIKKKQ